MSPETGTAHPGIAIERFTLGPFATNCYLVWEQGQGPDRPCWLIDVSFEPAPMLERARQITTRPQAIVLTHAHADHIAGVNEALRAFPGTPVLIHDAERGWLSDPMQNLSLLTGTPVTAQGPTGAIADGQELRLGASRWRVLHVPGHSPGGITLHNQEEGVALVGDALFAGSIGRTDFPGSDFDVLAASIREKLYVLPGDTVIYPGHGPVSTIERERRTNPFVRAQ